MTACGRCENTNMGFSDNRQTVGRQWGQAPVRIEPVTGQLALPSGNWQAKALDASGAVKTSASVISSDSKSYLVLDPKHETMWYWLTCVP